MRSRSQTRCLRGMLHARLQPALHTLEHLAVRLSDTSKFDEHLAICRHQTRTNSSALSDAVLTCGAIGIDHTTAINAVQASLAHPAVVAALSSAATLLATVGVRLGGQTQAESASLRRTATTQSGGPPQAGAYARDPQQAALASSSDRITEAEIWRVALSGLHANAAPRATPPSRRGRSGRQARSWCAQGPLGPPADHCSAWRSLLPFQVHRRKHTSAPRSVRARAHLQAGGLAPLAHARPAPLWPQTLCGGGVRQPTGCPQTYARRHRDARQRGGVQCRARGSPAACAAVLQAVPRLRAESAVR